VISSQKYVYLWHGLIGESYVQWLIGISEQLNTSIIFDTKYCADGILNILRCVQYDINKYFMVNQSRKMYLRE